MRLSCSTLACPDWNIEQAAAAAARYGYQGIELRLLDGEIVGPRLSTAQQARIRRACADAGLALCCLDTSLRVADPAAALDDGYAYLDLAAALSSPLIRVFGGAPDAETLAVAAARASDRLVALAEYGRAVGVDVALETHDTFAAGRSARAALGSSGAGVVWDVLHTLRAGESPAETLDLLAGRVLHVHVKDGALPPEPDTCLLLDQGAVPVPEILALLAARGYHGWLSVEWEKKWQPQIAAPQIALPHYAARLRRYLQAIEPKSI